MPSHAASEYRRACGELLKVIEARPGMYFETLRDVELLMAGHHMGFEQCRGARLENSFNRGFQLWIERTQGVTSPSGWAYSVSKMAKKRRREEIDQFFALLTPFMNIWAADSQSESS